MAGTIYLVTQLDIPSLRAAQRFRAYAHELGNQHVELVINRYDARRTEFSDERVSKALGQEPGWRIPNDFSTVCRSVNTGQSADPGEIAGGADAAGHGAGGSREAGHRR